MKKRFKHLYINTLGLSTVLFVVFGCGGTFSSKDGRNIFALENNGHGGSNPSVFFEVNLGQADDSIEFIGRGPGYQIFLTDKDVLFLAHHSDINNVNKNSTVNVKEKPTLTNPIRIRFTNKNPDARLIGKSELHFRSHYFLGNDESRWVTNIPNYTQVSYNNLYDGINAVFSGYEGVIEYCFLVDPYTDPSAISIEFPDADRLEITADGNLSVRAFGRSFVQKAPRLFQKNVGLLHSVKGGYVIRDKNKVGIWTGEYNKAVQLIIDPVITFSSYIGGPMLDNALGVTTDKNGNIYITGFTDSVNPGNDDVFVTKISPHGNVIYNTYLSGEGQDWGYGIAADSEGNAYIAGSTLSLDYPNTPGAFQGPCPVPGPNYTCRAAFVSKLNADGSELVYSTFIRYTAYTTSNNTVEGYGIDVDSAGSAYVTGQTSTQYFPITDGAYQSIYGGAGDAFITKLNPSGTDLIYSTYLGGLGVDAGNAIAVDDSGAAYITGVTAGGCTVCVNNFPTINAIQPESLEEYGGNDAFVTKIDPKGSELVFSTYLGGSYTDSGADIAIDEDGHTYVTGQTKSDDFPTLNPLMPPWPLTTTYGDAFVVKLLPDASNFVYSTHLGGSGYDWGTGIAADSDGRAYVTGSTITTTFPTTPDAIKSQVDREDAFVTIINTQGTALDFSTYLGGSGDDSGQSISVDNSGYIYVAGQTASEDFPTRFAFQPNYAGGFGDAFIVQLGPTPPPDDFPWEIFLPAILHGTKK